MSFGVGNFSSSLLPTTIRKILSMDIPMYGVKWESWPGDVQLLYDRKDKQIAISTDTVKGRDDFEDTPPFNVKECITQWNPSLGKREVLAYKGDSNWDSLVTAKTGDRMIEFPVFWYKRLGVAHIVISPEPRTGFKPSAAHYRNGTLYDKIRISKFCVPAEGSNIGVSNTVAMPNTTTNVTKLNNLRAVVRDKGGYLYDLCCHGMIQMLTLIKYATYDVRGFLNSALPGAVDITNGVTDTILGLDGKVGNYNSMFGLENMYGVFNMYADGVYGYGDKLYYTDVMNLTSTLTTASEITETCTPISPGLPRTYGMATKPFVKVGPIYVDWAWTPTQASSGFTTNSYFVNEYGGLYYPIIAGGSGYPCIYALFYGDQAYVGHRFFELGE